MAVTRDPGLAVVLEDMPGVRQEEGRECCDPVCGPDICGSEQVIQIELHEPGPAEAQTVGCCDPECGPGTCA